MERADPEDHCLLKIMLQELDDRERQIVLESVKLELWAWIVTHNAVGALTDELRATGLVQESLVDAFTTRVKSASDELIYGGEL